MLMGLNCVKYLVHVLIQAGISFVEEDVGKGVW